MLLDHFTHHERADIATNCVLKGPLKDKSEQSTPKDMKEYKNRLKLYQFGKPFRE